MKEFNFISTKMHKFVFFILLILSAFHTLKGQPPGRLHVFSENGERFFLYINGKLQNASLNAQVTTKDIFGEGCVMRIVFDDPTQGAKNFNVPLRSGKQVNILLQKNKKGELTMRYSGESEVVSEKPEPMEYMPNNISTKSSTSPKNEEKAMDETKTPQKSSNLTDLNMVTINETDAADEIENENCRGVSTYDFQRFISDVKTLDSEDERYAVMIKLNNKYCLSCIQIKEQISQLFTDKKRLGLIRFSYDQCKDKQNIAILQTALQTQEGLSEFEVFLQSKK